MAKKKKAIAPPYIIDKNEGHWRWRILIGTPSTGLYREEWVHARFSQVIPTNWTHATLSQPVPTYAPLSYLVADAQNLIVKHAIENKFEWVLLWERDNVPASTDYFIRLNEYMRDGTVPIVSGLYFTKSVPPEPMVYKGRGVSFDETWKMGDKIWVDGVPTGFLLISGKVLKVLWDESPEYKIGNQITRRVFETPARVSFNAELGTFASENGTSDLEMCSRIMRDGILAKAGWPELQKSPYPFLIDTNLFTWHVDDSGQMWPIGGVPKKYQKQENK